jgi:hypothetical protein
MAAAMRLGRCGCFPAVVNEQHEVRRRRTLPGHRRGLFAYLLFFASCAFAAGCRTAVGSEQST